MTAKEFDEAVKDFSPDKEDLKEKVNELFGKGAGTVITIHFIIEHLKRTLSEAMDIIDSCPNYQNRFK
ncbi:MULTISPECIES: hypothetical protein [Chryseobacterium]|uniref:Uncharacterized protein n=1 Tax=Candidatus Chryseobacterium massiliense TaxID=204089 RepID=A0A3D9B5F5_9FLAO|nr:MULTISPECIES: hypothetical protein [Chryseobacterium]REC48793.1 hypothetical protein DRF68_11325 [Candidatus Chryseobacterium massiliae]